MIKCTLFVQFLSYWLSVLRRGAYLRTKKCVNVIYLRIYFFGPLKMSENVWVRKSGNIFHIITFTHFFVRNGPVFVCVKMRKSGAFYFIFFVFFSFFREFFSCEKKRERRERIFLLAIVIFLITMFAQDGFRQKTKKKRFFYWLPNIKWLAI